MTVNRRTVGFNFLEEPELPAPQVSEAQAEQILGEHYGLRARATSLGSQQDRNFIVSADDGAIVGVLKIANPAFNGTELEAQDLAAELIADTEPDLRIAVPLPTVAGEKCATVTGLVDGTAYVRLLRYLPGGTLLESGYLSPTVVAGLGDVAGRVSRALADFTHPGLDRILQWDLRYGADVVTELISHVVDKAHRAVIETAAQQAWSRIAPLADDLRRQAVHLDLTDANVVVSRGAGGLRADGVIDFGDLTDSWAVAELAITTSCVLGHPGSDLTAVLPAVRAFNDIRPLSPAEAEALWPLLVLRTAVLVVSGAQQAALDPDNDYITEQSDGEWRMLEQATSVPMDVMTAVIKADLGLTSVPAAVEVTTPLVGSANPTVVTLDLSSASDVYDDGRWLTPDVEDEAARAAVTDGADLVVTAYGQPEAEPGTEADPAQPGGRTDRRRRMADGGHFPRRPVGRRGGECFGRWRDLPRRRLRTDAVRCARDGIGWPARRRTARGGTSAAVDADQCATGRCTGCAGVHHCGAGTGMACADPGSASAAGLGRNGGARDG